MTIGEILRLRLYNQFISSHSFKKPVDVVAGMGAVQAQDYAGAKWSIALRLPAATERDIEEAISDRSIIRTWPMRGTLHFIAADDIRWMLSLLTPRIIDGLAGHYRRLELGEEVFNKSSELLSREMEGGKQLMRSEIYDLLERNGIATSGQRGIHIINNLAQKQLLCHGVHHAKQPAFVLLDDWIPASRDINGEEVLAEIVYRYFTSHGPASIKDFCWWSGLRQVDAKTGVNAIADKLIGFEAEGTTFWSSPELPDTTPLKSVYLLPGFDEFILGYTDRTLMVSPEYLPMIVPGKNGMFMPTIIIDGKVQGIWKRFTTKDEVTIELYPFEKLSRRSLTLIEKAIEKFSVYLGKQVTRINIK